MATEEMTAAGFKLSKRVSEVPFEAINGMAEALRETTKATAQLPTAATSLILRDQGR
jgi:hypothetical protein